MSRCLLGARPGPPPCYLSGLLTLRYYLFSANVRERGPHGASALAVGLSGLTASGLTPAAQQGWPPTPQGAQGGSSGPVVGLRGRSERVCSCLRPCCIREPVGAAASQELRGEGAGVPKAQGEPLFP